MYPGNLTITAKGEREIIMSREFNAGRSLVYDAFTKPELLKRWLLGPDGWSLDVCEIDLKVGGKFRYVWHHKDGRSMGMGGEYRELQTPEKIVNTELFDEAWYSGESIITTVFSETNGKTLVVATMLYDSLEARDSVVHSPMEKGMNTSYGRLDRLLESTPVSGGFK
ncbi:SRPBCC family protein [Leptospira sp. WS92.C1]